MNDAQAGGVILDTPHIERRAGPGIGMPHTLWLNQFGSIVWGAFGHPPYLVGSALRYKDGWRDVDVRLILSDEEWEAWNLGDPSCDHSSEKWNALVMAFSALGKEMTGLPIDFQIQQQTFANAKYGRPDHQRSALGLIPLRMRRPGGKEQGA